MTDSGTAPTGGIDPIERQVANARMGLVPTERAAADGATVDEDTTP